MNLHRCHRSSISLPLMSIQNNQLSLPISTPDDTDHTPILQNKKFNPNSGELLASLRHAFLSFHSISSLLDIILRSSDGKLFHANKSNLICRSSYFHGLLNSDFKKSTSEIIRLPIHSATLEQILHFIYLGDVPLIQDILIRNTDPSSTSIEESKQISLLL